MNWKVLLSISAAIAMIPQFAAGQMEKRNETLYRLDAFVESFPRIGEHAPHITVKTLDGETVALSDYRGTNLVVIKGSYT